MNTATMQSKSEVKKADPRLIKGEAISKLVKTEEFKIFIEEVASLRNHANSQYIAYQADEGRRQRVIAFDEVLQLPEIFQRKMNAALIELR